MDNPQYLNKLFMEVFKMSFKPYYKWITLNTIVQISGLKDMVFCFKPYYKWITLNTLKQH